MSLSGSDQWHLCECDFTLKDSVMKARAVFAKTIVDRNVFIGGNTEHE